MKSRLIIFNIEMDVNSRYLSANIDLVDSFSSHYEKVTVYATHVGDTTPLANIRIVELGGGDILKRFRGAFRLILAIIRVTQHRKDSEIFYHMVTRIPALVGRYFKLIGVTQFIWYSHSVADKYLSKAVNNVDFVFSPTSQSFPIKTSKLISVGHGVKSGSFGNLNRNSRHGAITVGRVVPIKKITELIERYVLMAAAERELINPLIIVGDNSIDYEYVEKIKSQAINAGLEVVFVGQIPREVISEYLNIANFYYLGTPKSIDKAAIEASMCGCIVLSENLEAVSILGSKYIQEKSGIQPLTLEAQLNAYAKLSDSQLKELQSEISIQSKKLNEISEVVKRIVASLNVD